MNLCMKVNKNPAALAVSGGGWVWCVFCAES